MNVKVRVLAVASDRGRSAANTMAKRTRIKVGDVFGIPLAEQAYSLSLCTFVFRTFKNCIACRIFDAMFDDPILVEPMPTVAAFDPLFMGKQIITAGTWPIVGNIDVDFGPLMFRVADGKYNGDSYVGQADTGDLPELLVYGPVGVQQLLRQHFGLDTSRRTRRCT